MINIIMSKLNSIITIAIIIVLGISLYYVFSTMSKSNIIKEGFDVTTSNGETGNASAYATTIKLASTKLLDGLLVSKYRKDYENIVIHMDDLVESLMLKTLLDTDVSDETKLMSTLEKINSLKDSKNSLNVIMKFIDKQP